MPYRLIARGTSRPTINGQVRSLRPNDTIIVTDDEKERLMRGIFRDKFIVGSYIKSKKEEDSLFNSSETLSNPPEESYSEEVKLQPKPEESKEEEEDTSIILKLEKEGLPNPPLDQGTHWATVRSHVQDLEDQIPIPFNMVRAIRLKFGHYVKVVEECDRVLEMEED